MSNDNRTEVVLYDRPSDFIYPTVLLPTLNVDCDIISQLLPLEVDSLVGLYVKSFGIPLNELPLNLEYYIFTAQSLIDYVSVENKFMFICLATAVLYVLHDLWILLEFKINMEYYSVQTEDINASVMKIETLSKVLSPTEKSIFQLYCSGASVTSMASKKNISESTVRGYLNRIAQKAGLTPANKTTLDEYLKTQTYKLL